LNTGGGGNQPYVSLTVGGRAFFLCR
jgi:hypothetical protein